MSRTFTIASVLLLALIMSGCLDDDDNSLTVNYTDVVYSFEIELLEDNWYNEIRKYNEDEELVQTITYEYGNDTIIKRIFDEDNDRSEIHYYMVDSSRRAQKSWDTLFTDNGRHTNRLTYTRDTATQQLRKIDHEQKIVENGTVVQTNNYTYNFEFDDGDLSRVGRTGKQGTCYDEYYTTDSAAVLDVYAYRKDMAMSFDGRITGDFSGHLLQGIALAYNCYPSGYLPQEIIMNYQLNDDNTIEQLIYLIFPGRSPYANTINADRITHHFTYMNVE